MLGGWLAFLLVLDRTILEFVDHHHTIAVVADPVLSRLVLDHAVKACLFRTNKEHRAITRQYIDPGRQVFLVVVAFLLGDGELIFLFRHYRHITHAEVTFLVTFAHVQQTRTLHAIGRHDQSRRTGHQPVT
ncbi:hypothetical protein D3C76_1268370 [compost metagenome]